MDIPLSDSDYEGSSDYESDYSPSESESDVRSDYDPITFIECDRESTTTILDGLKDQLRRGVGVGGDIYGTLEVAFKGESSAGSAVVREWIGVAAAALTSSEAGLFASSDGGRTFRPAPSACRAGCAASSQAFRSSSS